MLKIFIAALFMMMVPVAGAQAHSYHKGDILIGHVWAPPSQNGTTSVYGPLMNNGAEADTLLSAQSPVAGTIVFVSDHDGQRQEQDSIALPPGGEPVSLAAWGVHIELSDIKTPLANGTTFPLTLTFAHAGEITVEIEVETEASPQ